MSISIISVPSTINSYISQLSYQTFGLAVGSAPVILINHALTGNSTLLGINGWWDEMVGVNKTINTLKYTIVVFNIPGNGYDNFFIADYKKITTKQIAQLFWYGLEQLKIQNLYAIVGGSLGGAIGWEMILQHPTKVSKFVPIATHYKTNNWLAGNVYIQDSILNHSKKPMQDARKHAMFLYRSPAGINQKFLDNKAKVLEWLDYHGKALENRFTLKAYKLVNHLLSTIGQDVTDEVWEYFTKEYKGEIHIISVNTDLLFIPEDQEETYQKLKSKIKTSYNVIHSVHGHDAFLIEFDQLSNILNPLF